jgi:hypothetical protein
MRKIFFILAILVVLSVSVHAFEISSVNLDKIKSDYNSDLENIPWIVKMVAGTEKITIQIQGQSSVSTLSLETKDGEIIYLGTDALENPTMLIKMTEEQIQEMLNSGNPLVSLADFLKSGKVQVEANGIGMTIKMFFMNILIFLSGLFG